MIGVERFLHCLSLSVHAGEFVLKGSMLFDVWNRRMHRLTRDLDLLGAGAANVESVRNCMPGVLPDLAVRKAMMPLHCGHFGD